MNTHFYKYFNFLSMLYITFLLAAVVLCIYIANFDGIPLNEGAMIIPFMYLFGDVIAEVYGYDKSKKLIYYSLACDTIFIVLILLMIKLPSPPSWHDRSSYLIVFGSLHYVLFSNLLAIPLSEFVNVLVLTKTKLMLKGKYFWLRSLLSSATGELTLAITGNLLLYFNGAYSGRILQIILSSFFFKICFSLFTIIPTTIFVAILKELENVESEQNQLGFIPF